jgi:Mrp family chromosome partitioning ATPase
MSDHDIAHTSRPGAGAPQYTAADMSAPIITFFNNKGGVGKTSLVYHLAWMLADLGHRVVAADLDPQANLTAAFLEEAEIERLWEGTEATTVWSVIRPFVEEEGSLGTIYPYRHDGRAAGAASW